MATAENSAVVGFCWARGIVTLVGIRVRAMPARRWPIGLWDLPGGEVGRRCRGARGPTAAGGQEPQERGAAAAPTRAAASMTLPPLLTEPPPQARQTTAWPVAAPVTARHGVEDRA